MKIFLTGLGVGAVLGLMFAPKAGEDTRSDLRERIEGLADRVTDMVEGLKDGEGQSSKQQR